MKKPKSYEQRIDDLIHEAKDIGRMWAQVDFGDVVPAALTLLRDYGKGINLCDHTRMHIAENLWHSIHKINPDLEMPPFLWRYHEDMDEARFNAQHIAEDHGVPGGDK